MKRVKNIPEPKEETAIDFLRAAVPIASALVIFLVSAGFILYKFLSARRYNERWKDYDECGLV